MNSMLGWVVDVSGALWDTAVSTVKKRGQVLSQFGTVAIKPHLSKMKLKRPITMGLPIAKLRPWKFTDRFSEADIENDKNVLEEKIDGVLVEMVIGKDGKVKKMMSARGQKVDFRPILKDLSQKEYPESVRDSKIYFECRHPRGLHFMTGLLHSDPDRAAQTIKEDGHPEAYVLAVHKLGGHDTSDLKYEEMRGLREAVAHKLPHGKVPANANSSSVNRKAFRKKIFDEIKKSDNPRCDGIVAYDKTVPNKGMRIPRPKPPRSWKFVIMGYNKSSKVPGVKSLEIGDGVTKLGNVNVANPDLRTTIEQNWDRYNRTVVRISGQRRTRSGNVFQPKIDQFCFKESADDVPKWNPHAASRGEEDKAVSTAAGKTRKAA